MLCFVNYSLHSGADFWEADDAPGAERKRDQMGGDESYHFGQSLKGLSGGWLFIRSVNMCVKCACGRDVNHDNIQPNRISKQE